jgi:hypothetical protein
MTRMAAKGDLQLLIEQDRSYKFRHRDMSFDRDLREIATLNGAIVLPRLEKNARFQSTLLRAISLSIRACMSGFVRRSRIVVGPPMQPNGARATAEPWKKLCTDKNRNQRSVRSRLPHRVAADTLARESFVLASDQIIGELQRDTGTPGDFEGFAYGREILGIVAQVNDRRYHRIPRQCRQSSVGSSIGAKHIGAY